MSNLLLILLSIPSLFSSMHRYTNKDYGYSVMLPTSNKIDSVQTYVNLGYAKGISYAYTLQTEDNDGLFIRPAMYLHQVLYVVPDNKFGLLSFYNRFKADMIEKEKIENDSIISSSMIEKDNQTEIVSKIYHKNILAVEYRKIIIIQNRVYCFSYITKEEYVNVKNKDFFFNSVEILDTFTYDITNEKKTLQEIQELNTQLEKEYFKRYFYYEYYPYPTNILDNDSLLTFFDSILSKDPDNLNAMRSRGLVKQKMNKYSEAILDYNYCLTKNNKDSFSLVNRAICNANLTNNKYAIQDLNQAIASFSTNPSLYCLRGKCRNSLSDFDSAIADFTFAILRTINYTECYFGRGFAYARTNKIHEAKKDLEMLYYANDSTSKWKILILDAIIKELENDYDAAISNYKKLLEIIPDDEFVLGQLITLFNNMRNFSEALVYCDKAIKHGKYVAEFRIQKAYIYTNINEFENAIIELRKGLVELPNNDYALYLKAYSEKQVRKFDEALVDYNKAIELNKKNALYYFERGKLKIIQYDKKGACEDLYKAKKLGQKGTDILTKGYCK